MTTLSFATLARILAASSGTAVSDVAPSSDLVRDLRMDSLEFLQALAEVEDLGWMVDERDVARVHTVADLMGALRPVSAAVL